MSTAGVPQLADVVVPEARVMLFESLGVGFGVAVRTAVAREVGELGGVEEAEGVLCAGACRAGEDGWDVWGEGGGRVRSVDVAAKAEDGWVGRDGR